jgi:hypothetical protein
MAEILSDSMQGIQTGPDATSNTLIYTKRRGVSTPTTMMVRVITGTIKFRGNGDAATSTLLAVAAGGWYPITIFDRLFYDMAGATDSFEYSS